MERRPSGWVVYTLVLCLAGVLAYSFAAANSEGELTYAMHVTLPPVWFDPGENTGIISPKMIQYGKQEAESDPKNPGDGQLPHHLLSVRSAIARNSTPARGACCSG